MCILLIVSVFYLIFSFINNCILIIAYINAIYIYIYFTYVI